MKKLFYLITALLISGCYYGSFEDLGDSYIYMDGRIDKEIDEKRHSLNTIGTHTEDTGMMNIPFDRIRFINIDTDYLNSLNLYMEIKKETQP